MKRILALVISLMVLIPSAAFAEDGAINIYLKGEKIVFSQSLGQPFIATKNSKGRTMIPLRAVSEKMGYEVSWNQTDNAAEIKGDGIQISLPIGKDYGLVNGEKLEFDSQTVSTNGRTYVPLRFISETLGMHVVYKFGKDERSNNEIAMIIDITDMPEGEN